MKKRKIAEPAPIAPVQPAEPLRIDLGCGPNKRQGFKGADSVDFLGVDFVVNLAEPEHAPVSPGFEWMIGAFERRVIGYKPWPWADGRVEEAHSSHFIEHLGPFERAHFWNQLWRVLRVGGKATIIAPHWASCRAYGDPTHRWAPVSEFGMFYLSRAWRAANAPHTDATNIPLGLSCNFDAVWGYSIEPGVALRNQEYQQHALTYFKEAAQDMIATLTKLE
jgi:hypothetical protein